MNYRKLDDLRFTLFSYGLLMLGVLFIIESVFGGLEQYHYINQCSLINQRYAEMGLGEVCRVSLLALVPQISVLVLKFFAGLVFLYISLEELKITRIEEALLRRKRRRK